jgi:clan AA aspartic protease
MELIKPTSSQGTLMGLTYVDLTLTHPYEPRSVSLRALVDTGSNHTVINPAVAKALGFDIEEVRTINVTLANGSRVKVPIVDPIRIHYLEYMCGIQAAVMDCDECLLGVVALQAMGLMVNPNTHALEYDPRTEGHKQWPLSEPSP